MAFEVPLDADRVDDSNLFSTFVRAPLIGTILWILGGNKQEEDEAREKLHGDLDPTTTTIQHQSSSMKRPCSKQRSALKKAAPSLLGSDISDVGEVRESLESMCLYQETLSKYIPGLPKKELSWSDESGRELVDYGKESTLHQPKPADEQPVRSAMSRSRSIKSNANRLEKSQMDNKYLPSSHRPNNSLLKQTMPYTTHHGVEPFSSGTGGYESPQWGWYINTTPPTPEMYYSRPTKSVKPDLSSETSQASSSGEASIATIGNSHHPNPVFQGLQDKHKASPMGWPSVPL